jgi:N-acetylglucosaminyldiphosphoundecaprenol N-acetyl-beta-D-mannosaminyltransferase
MVDSRLLGVRMETRPLPDLVAEAQIALRERRTPFIFSCANPHSLVVARGDPEFRRALEEASTVVADGVGCKWAAALTGIAIGPRITGSDFLSPSCRPWIGPAVGFFSSDRGMRCWANWSTG